MGFLNKCIMLGNVTRNPEVRYIPGNNTAVAKFGLATNRKYKSGSETKEETCFIDIVSFGKTAEMTGEYITKGMPILVEGRLSYNTWEKDGVKYSKHEIIADNIQFVERKSTSSAYSNNADGSSFSEPNVSSNTGQNDINEEDIPF